MIWLSNAYNTSVSPSFCLPLCPSFYLCTYLAFCSLRLQLRTSLRTVSGPRQKRRNLKTMSSLPNSPQPSPRSQSVSVRLVCFYFLFSTAVIMLCPTVMSNVFFLTPLTSLPSLPNSMPISILLLCFHQPLKVRISRTHFHLAVFFFTHLLQPFSPFPSSAWRTHCTFTLFNNAVSKQHLTQVHE